MPDAIALFSLRLIVGMAFVCLALARPGFGVVSPFFRILMLLLLGLAVLGGLASAGGDQLAALLLAVACFVGSIFWLLERRTWGLYSLGVALMVGLYWMSRILYVQAANGTIPLPVLIVATLASAATLGTALCGMLLGHRYLTAPGMPLAPLFLANQLLGAAAVVRLIVSLAALAWFHAALTQPTWWIWLSLRWLAGIAGPLAVWFMVRKILVFRNTQSATGVLFVGVILTFIGELTGDLLFRTLGAPF
ncbi:MAG: hypothetical protein ACKV0T_11015 [Planctomycetales bacterium]